MATAQSNAIKRGILTMRATVYSRTANTGPYNKVLVSDLACRLDTVNIQPGRTSAERADLAALRTFSWDVDYTLPEQGIQIEVTSPALYAGKRWNVKPGTTRPAIPPGFSEPIATECDVVRSS
jgi:hypothetical protein